MEVDELSKLNDPEYVLNNYSDIDYIIKFITTQNFKKINITINETSEIYILYHGFPGDNPHGMAYNINNANDWVCVGENCENINEHLIKNGLITKNGLMILDWYNKLTDDCCDYDNEIWK